MNIPSEFIDVHKAAAILNISENRLRKWVKKGKIPYHRFNDHRILFKQSEIIEFIPIAWVLLGRDDNRPAPEPS